MFGIVIGTHGEFALGIVQSCEMIYGKRDKVKAVTLVPGEGPDDIYEKYQKAIKELGNPEQVLFLNDLLGGTPYNQAARIVSENENYGIVAGLNLPALIAAVSMQDADEEGIAITELVEKVKEACKEGAVAVSYESLNSSSDDDEL